MTKGQELDPQFVRAVQGSTAPVTSNQLISFVNENWSVGQTIAEHLRIDELSFKANVLLHLPRIITASLRRASAKHRRSIG
jgi:hypothetical protein